MIRHIAFGSIEKFEVVLKNIKHTASYKGLDENGKVIYDRLPDLPKVEAIGTEKIHGTNASICVTADDFWVQKKTDIITPTNDNAGCAFFAMQNKDAWIRLANQLAYEYNIDLTKNIITIFYEWCGGNIQDNSCVSKLDKRSIIFQYFKVAPLEGNETEKNIWLETRARLHKKPDCAFEWIESPENNIFNIRNFPFYRFEIDFANPNKSINEMVDIVLNKIEPNSPVGRSFGIDGNVGEGIVVTFEYKGEIFRFKVKGEKHSKSKVKTLQPIDDSKDKAKMECANKVTPAWRLEQAMQNLFGIAYENKEPTSKDISDFIKEVTKDIVKEELDTIASFGLELKSIHAYVSKICVQWFKEELVRIAVDK